MVKHVKIMDTDPLIFLSEQYGRGEVGLAPNHPSNLIITGINMPTVRDEVMSANSLFYQAFNQGDYPVMDDLWASIHDVCVIHPGWAPLHGRAPVMKSWRRILKEPPGYTTTITDAKAYLMEGAAFVLCYETLPEVVLIATNIFVLENERWKMVHHQSGQVYQDVLMSSQNAVH
jgi:hypothetical protein